MAEMNVVLGTLCLFVLFPICSGGWQCGTCLHNLSASISCRNNSIIALQEVKSGRLSVGNCSTEVVKKKCVDYCPDPTDESIVRRFQEHCSGKSRCDINTRNLTCPINSFLAVQSKCISQDVVVNMCSVEQSPRGKMFQLMFTPSSNQSSIAHVNCTCQIRANANVTVDAVDVRRSSENTDLTFFTDEDSLIYRPHTYGFRNMLITNERLFNIRLLGYDEKHIGKIWIQIKVSGKNGRAMVTCSRGIYLDDGSPTATMQTVESDPRSNSLSTTISSALLSTVEFEDPVRTSTGSVQLTVFPRTSPSPDRIDSSTRTSPEIDLPTIAVNETIPPTILDGSRTSTNKGNGILSTASSSGQSSTDTVNFARGADDLLLSNDSSFVVGGSVGAVVGVVLIACGVIGVLIYRRSLKKRMSKTSDLTYDTLDHSFKNNQYAEIKKFGHDNLTILETSDRHRSFIANENTYAECDRSDVTQNVIYSAIESTSDPYFPSELAIGTDYSYESNDEHQNPGLEDAGYFCIEPEAEYSESVGISNEMVEEHAGPTYQSLLPINTDVEAGPTYQSLLPINTDATYATPLNPESFTDAGYFDLQAGDNMVGNYPDEN